MNSLIVVGNKRLQGEITIQGAKNTVLPVIAASVMIEGCTKIYNCPDILDVRDMLDIISGFGGKYSFKDNILEINNSIPSGYVTFPDNVRMRASVMFMGALAGIGCKFSMPYPGGCNIGKRPINYHIDGIRRMGAYIEEQGGFVCVKSDGLCGAAYHFNFPSVGALENMILAAVKAKGRSVFTGCAKEPEICDLCDFLRIAGANISGAGTDRIVIEGVDKLHECEYYTPGDRIAAGTYMAACRIAGGNISIHGIEPERLRSVTDIFKYMGTHIAERMDSITVICDNTGKNPSYIETGSYPEFPTDMQSQLMAVAAAQTGECRICDRIFENRYGTASELCKMNADIRIINGNSCAVIRPHGELNPAVVKAGDLRGGAALVAAALGIKGKSIIENCIHIQRGYEDIQRDLKRLGADIEWQKDAESEKRVKSGYC